MDPYKINSIIVQLQQAISALQAILNSQATNKSKLAAQAKNDLGIDVTPTDQIPDDVACASCVTTEINKIIQFPHIPSTFNLLQTFKKDPRFIEIGINDISAGDIILCATGTATVANPTISNGHVGIMLDTGRIANNNSATGLWKDTYTVDSWCKRWFEYPVHVFRINS